MADDPNILYYGDNLDVLRRHIADASVDLVYLDPPFNSNADYNVLFSEHGEKASAQIQAFEDTWEWNTEAAAAYQEIVERGGGVAEAMRAFRTMVGDSDMLAYLSMMAPRLVELRRVLKPSGSIYLHCDPTASHYLKLLMDSVFGPANYRTEIIWRRASGFKRSSARRFPHKHDVILFYCKDPARLTFHPQFRKHKPEYIKRFKRDVTGRLYRDDVNPTAGGRRTIYLDEVEGDLVDSVWADINPINPVAAERLGYPTQKPIALMERIIAASSDPGDLVLDPFCGCGTTVDAAQALGRRWIGIDVTHLAIGLIKHRLAGRYGPGIAATYRTIGEPTTVEGARMLAAEDPWQFQAWALGLVGARQAGSAKKGGDKGIDGKLYFHDSPDMADKQIVFSVKAGHLVPSFIRDLRGVIDREEAQIGVLISFEEPTSGMRSEAASAGFYDSPWGRHPRIQLRTVGELLEGKGIDYPHMTNVTHRRAPRAKAAEPERLELFGQVAEEPEPFD
ncbi:MAG: site-specific DNA-methyltransferase [Chloroflexi bacterium]|nr:site-specific DNA-methyltransferase [Chloroflexota bacterium]